MHAVCGGGFANLQPKAPAPMIRMEEGADSSGELEEDMLNYGERGWGGVGR